MPAIRINRSVYYHILYVYYVTEEHIPRTAAVAINKSYDRKQYDELLAKEPFFEGKKIEGYSLEDMVDYSELNTTKCEIVVY